ACAQRARMGRGGTHRVHRVSAGAPREIPELHRSGSHAAARRGGRRALRGRRGRCGTICEGPRVEPIRSRAAYIDRDFRAGARPGTPQRVNPPTHQALMGQPGIRCSFESTPLVFSTLSGGKMKKLLVAAVMLLWSALTFAAVNVNTA